MTGEDPSRYIETMDGNTAIGLVVLVAILYVLGSRRLKLQKAKEAYATALARLTAAPTDNKLRIKALDAGRRYAALAGRAGGRAVFDEIALHNDLSARVAKSAPPSEKQCPRCAESVKAAAQLCRFCGHTFAASA